MPFAVPENNEMHISGNGYNYLFTNVLTSKLYLIGFPGLEVKRTDFTRNGDKTYAAPKNVE